MKHLKRKILPLVACTSLGVMGLSYLGGYNVFSSQSNSQVVLSDFASGTNVSYEVLANGSVVDKGRKVLGDDGELTLPVVDEKTGVLTYRLHLESADAKSGDSGPAETLDLLLGLNKNTGNLSVSGSGVNEFSEVIVKNGDETKSLTADWAGLFASNSVNVKKNKEAAPLHPEYNKQIELAFQGAGIDSDFNRLGSGKVDVLFGDSSGSNRGDVRVRYSWALREMAEELSAVMVMQTEAVGMFFDATAQLRTQRKHQELRARAHKDYHPSEQMCRIGTFMRSVAHTESKAEVNKHVLNKIMMNQYLGRTGNTADYGPSDSQYAELYSFSHYYCDPRDNDGGASGLCPRTSGSTPADEQNRFNRDVDYARMIGNKLTIDVDYSDGDTRGTANNDLEDDEADIIALAKNLYFPNVFELPREDVLDDDARAHYKSRSFSAKMNVAHSSFLNIVGMKSSAPVGQATTATATSPAIPANIISPRVPTPPVLAEDAGWAYMKSMLREFGITDENGSGDTDDEINSILGERPSYYAQMEVLTKKIYQHPNFYTNLYDKPVNVDRIGASIDAITIMHQRDRFESLLRREMLTSLLIEEGLGKHVEDVSSAIYEGMNKAQEKLN
ncbi:MAG: hypothetical protein ACRBB3_06890 [Alphaproteobacteria bacterium]